MQDEKFGLRFVVAEMQLAHPPELLERLVDVPYSQALAGVVGHSPFSLTLHFHLGREVLIVFIVQTGRRWRSQGAERFDKTKKYAFCTDFQIRHPVKQCRLQQHTLDRCKSHTASQTL